MDTESKANFDRITKKELHELTPDDILFLKSRRSYFTPEQLEHYSGVLGIKKKETPKQETKPEIK